MGRQTTRTQVSLGKRVALFGCLVDAMTMDETVRRIEDIVRSGGPIQHCALNAAGLVAMQDDERLRQIVQRCGHVSADGQSLVWASRALRQQVPERVAGPDLFMALIRSAAERGWTVYLLGAEQTVLWAARTELLRRYPDLQIVGVQNGYFDESESDRIVQEIRGSGARMLFVALPTPMKEYWIADHLEELGVPFCMGVGGTFDIVSGHITRAPIWMQSAGLEWVYRLFQEPKRMWRRYLVGNTRFATMFVRELLSNIGPNGNRRS
ncbi:MAG: beta-1 [Actinobacteria bacterium]|nr:MAG: beta-1 [Actinomycetota bacterium]